MGAREGAKTESPICDWIRVRLLHIEVQSIFGPIKDFSFVYFGASDAGVKLAAMWVMGDN